MQTKSHYPHAYRPDQELVKDRRASAHHRQQKLAEAKDHDWKQETTMLSRLGYHNTGQ